jgi:hypothetical protein
MYIDHYYMARQCWKSSIYLGTIAVYGKLTKQFTSISSWSAFRRCLFMLPGQSSPRDQVHPFESNSYWKCWSQFFYNMRLPIRSSVYPWWWMWPPEVGRWNVYPSVLKGLNILFSLEKQMDEQWNFAFRGQSSLLGANFTPRGPN